MLGKTNVVSNGLGHPKRGHEGVVFENNNFDFGVFVTNG
jgi:hypothetical protein